MIVTCVYGLSHVWFGLKLGPDVQVSSTIFIQTRLIGNPLASEIM